MCTSVSEVKTTQRKGGRIDEKDGWKRRKELRLRRAVKVNTVEEMKGETELKVTVDLSPYLLTPSLPHKKNILPA